MRAYWAHFRQVCVHKWYVFLECCKLGIPLRGITHDLSKFSLVEWKAYALSFHSGWKKDERPRWVVQMFEQALDHHYDHNPHHWNHWLQKVGNRRIPVEMPEMDRLEMLADWRAMARQYGSTVSVWYAKNCNEIHLPPRTRAWLEAHL